LNEKQASQSDGEEWPPSNSFTKSLAVIWRLRKNNR